MAHAAHPVVEVRTDVHATDVAPCVAKAPAAQGPEGVLSAPSQYIPVGHGLHVPEPFSAEKVPDGQGVHKEFVAPPVEYAPLGQSPPVEAAHDAHPIVDVCTTVQAAVIAPCVAKAPAAHEPDGALSPPAHHCPAVQGVHVLASTAEANVPGGHADGAETPSRQYAPAPHAPSQKGVVRRVFALPK